MNIEKMIDTAVDLKIATLRAKEQGIISYTEMGNKFRVYDEKNFRRMLEMREYKIKRFNNPPYKYEYKVVVLGLNLTYIAIEYLFTGDADKLES